MPTITTEAERHTWIKAFHTLEEAAHGDYLSEEVRQSAQNAIDILREEGVSAEARCAICDKAHLLPYTVDDFLELRAMPVGICRDCS